MPEKREKERERERRLCSGEERIKEGKVWRGKEKEEAGLGFEWHGNLTQLSCWGLIKGGTYGI